MNIQTYPPNDPQLTQWSNNPLFIVPHQTHSTNIVEVVTGNEDLNDCDGLWTKRTDLRLGVKTADCAPIAFWDGEKYGIIHAGWRGLCDGIVEEMCKIFSPENPHTQVWVGPLYPQFEIQRDDCYDRIYAKFGDKHFTEADQKIFFNFKTAIAEVLPQAQFDPRSTYDTLSLASWRRDQDQLRNITIIG